jgi:hypothetical protein
VTEKKKFRILNDRIRHNAMQAVYTAPEGYVVRVEEPNRSNRQNAMLWALLSDVAKAKPEGRQWTPDTWKAAFMHSTGHQIMFAEGLDGSGPFPVGFRSSQLSVAQMGDLITCIQEYGDRHGVEWTDTRDGGFMEDWAA